MGSITPHATSDPTKHKLRILVNSLSDSSTACAFMVHLQLVHSLFEGSPGLERVTSAELHCSRAKSFHKLKAQPYLPRHRLQRIDTASEKHKGDKKPCS